MERGQISFSSRDFPVRPKKAVNLSRVIINVIFEYNGGKLSWSMQTPCAVPTPEKLEIPSASYELRFNAADKYSNPKAYSTENGPDKFVRQEEFHCILNVVLTSYRMMSQTILLKMNAHWL
jgi:hypothetical protein